MKRLTMIAAAWLGASATAAGAAPAEMPCVTAGEGRALVQLALPDALNAIGKACASSLPPAATLRAGLPALIARYQIDSDAAWPAARTAVARLAGDQFGGMDPDALRPLLRVFVAPPVAEAIRQGDCPQIDRIASLLSPLPATGIADLIVQFVQLRRATTTTVLPLTICPDHG